MKIFKMKIPDRFQVSIDKKYYNQPLLRPVDGFNEELRLWIKDHRGQIRLYKDIPNNVKPNMEDIYYFLTNYVMFAEFFNEEDLMLFKLTWYE